MSDVNYVTTSQLLLTGAVLLFAFPAQSRPDRKQGNILCALILLGFIYTSGKGLYYHWLTPDIRLRMNTSATLTAYLYMLQSLLTVYAMGRVKWPYYRLVMGMVIAVSLVIILLTETRSVLVLFPLMMAIFYFNRKVHLTVKSLSGIFIVLMLSGVAVHYVFPGSAERVKNTVQEISALNNDNKDTSLGARVVLWDSGVEAFLAAPLGESSHDRYERVKHFILTEERGSAEALRNAVYHLHNDFIEAASLQGVPGLIALTYFYLSVLVYLIAKQLIRPVFFFLYLPVLIIGMVDSLYINDRFIVLLILQLILYRSLQPLFAKEGRIA